MPYISQELRDTCDSQIDLLVDVLKEEGFRPGIVTYVFYRIIREMFFNNGCYDTIADIRGILTGTMDEFNRRLAHDYEDKKIKENGDVV